MGYVGESVTLIGLGDGFDVKIYVKDVDLAAFAYECQEYEAL